MGVFSRVVRTTIPVGAAAYTAYAYKDEIAADGIYGVTAPFRQLHALVSTASNSWTNSSSTFDSSFPRGQWNSNWDFRDPMSLVDERKYSKATDEEKEKMIKDATPKFSRTIVLIRHGQYDLENKPYALTELGREQAVLVGQRLAELHKSAQPIDEVHMSTMTRATETANIILKQLPSGLPSSSDSILEEGAPYPPEPAVGHWRPHVKKFYSEGARIESAFRKYIHRASVKQKKDTTEVIVCHANVIRYFVCRALQFPPEGWLRMSIGNTSITVLIIRPNGRVSMRSVGDIGHLPGEKISFT
ncbi:hypothetical protein PRIPAC_90391 [Pristionchus pacificus]|uniref:Serine/threonine-protein phosphatase PGAM5, mitochondrial n=1 Tax=Pristionchus pacificus TaxID=54126 RepID=A0A2A6B7K6_PRIPA|nr:hypothetical protein PRIPAC_90391 [Pristionchus pacificus]|eukprot:PDM61851.1 hypothetical protein PRIPAC_51293 [Pristionchus pacificus]